MTNFESLIATVKKAGIATSMLAILCGGATALPPSAGAQVAGGSQAGFGIVVDNSLRNSTVPPVEPPRCIHRTKDLRRSGSIDEDQLSTWLSVRHPVVVIIAASGSASGDGTGSLAITVSRDNIPVANSPETRGTSLVFTHTSASLKLIPGRQYRISAKAAVSNKRLDLFDMYVGVGEVCR